MYLITLHGGIFCVDKSRQRFPPPSAEKLIDPPGPALTDLLDEGRAFGAQPPATLPLDIPVCLQLSGDERFVLLGLPIRLRGRSRYFWIWVIFPTGSSIVECGQYSNLRSADLGLAGTLPVFPTQRRWARVCRLAVNPIRIGIRRHDLSRLCC